MVHPWHFSQQWEWAEQASPEEGDGDAAEDDGAPDARAVLSVARRAHAEDGPPHVRLRLLHQEQKGCSTLQSAKVSVDADCQYPSAHTDMRPVPAELRPMNPTTSPVARPSDSQWPTNVPASYLVCR